MEQYSNVCGDDKSRSRLSDHNAKLSYQEKHKLQNTILPLKSVLKCLFFSAYVRHFTLLFVL
jgi:hypothetical protein